MGERDIRPSALFSKYLELCETDITTYFRSPHRETLPCPGCNHPVSEPAFEKAGFGYCVCKSCHTLYQNPRPSPEEFSRFYSDSPSSTYWANTFFPAVAEVRREKLFKPKVMQLAELCRLDGFRPTSVADVGAGFGIFLDEWRRVYRDARTIAIEPNPRLAAVCRSKGLEVIQRFVEEAADSPDKVDMVVAMELVEHVHSPMQFCLSLKHLLRRGGKLLLTGLTVDGFDIQTLWEHSKSVSPPHHINFMSIQGFSTLLNRAGFSNVRIFTPGELDVDIVANSERENPATLRNERFIRHLLQRRPETLVDFQKFLSDHQLSSHCWVWAEK